MSSAITTAGQARISELMGTEQALVIDRMVLALIPDLDASQAVDRDQQLPDPAYIVHTADIADENKGYVGPDEVVYSVVLGSDLGDFSFNWIGTLEKDTDTVITVTTTPETPKRKTDLANSTTGNCITRNIILAFQNAQAVTGITVTAETWQFDYEAAFALHAAGAVDPSQEGSDNLHITNDLAKQWDEGIKSNTTRLGAFESSTSLIQEFAPNKIQAELFATGYTLYDETETTWDVNLTTGTALAIDSGVYEVHGLTVDNLNQSKAAVVRRTDNDAVLDAFFRDGTHPEWTPAPWAWKRDAEDNFIDIEYLVQARGSFDMRFESTAGVSGVDPTIDHIIFVECESGLGGDHRSPVTPSIISPANGAVDISEQPSLTTSVYVSPTGDNLHGTRFQISKLSDFAEANIVADSGVVSGISWSPDKGVLSTDTPYYVRALHVDTYGGLSEWSASVQFTTATSFVTVLKPSITAPVNSAKLSSPNGLTIVSSAFGTEGGSDTHASSTWQISEDPAFGTTVVDTGSDGTNLTSYDVADDTLERGKTYYCRVMHEGTAEGASDWSNTIVFSVSTLPVFVSIYGGGGNDIFKGMALDGNGNLYCAGYENSTGTKALLVKFDSDGGIVWQRTLGGATMVGFHSVTVDGDGNIYAVGYKYSSEYSGLIVKFSADGSIVWQRELGTSSHGTRFYGVKAGSDGNVYAVGVEDAGSGQGILAKFTSVGSLVSERVLSDVSVEGYYGLDIGSDGYLYVVGYEYSSTGSGNALLAKFDSNLSLQWQVALGGSSHNEFRSVVVGGSGDIYAAGRKYSTGNDGQGILAKFNSDGGIVWQNIFGGNYDDQFNAVAVDDSGDVYAAGHVGTSSYSCSSLISKFTSDGDAVWQRAIGSPGEDFFYSVAVDALGILYAAGSEYDNSQTIIASITHEALGTTGTIPNYTTLSWSNPDLALSPAGLTLSNPNLNETSTSLPLSTPSLTLSTPSFSQTLSEY